MAELSLSTEIVNSVINVLKEHDASASDQMVSSQYLAAIIGFIIAKENFTEEQRNEVIKNKKTNLNPIWIMRQAGRYLPEFREIRKKNPDFIKLCLNTDLINEITLQPLKRFDLDAAIIFSDILMLPYGLNQKVEFEKGFGPKLGEVNIDEMSKLDEIDFVEMIPKQYLNATIDHI